MRLSRVRFTIGRLMVSVAVVAVLLAWLDVRAAVALVALVGLGFVVIIPVAFASPGRRLEAASWASSLQPAAVLFYLYVTWVTAWCLLGHRPRPWRDDPEDISPVVTVPYIMCFFSLLYGWAICACTGTLLSVVCYARRSNIRPLLALPFAWLAGYLGLMWDPLGVLDWFMD